MSAAFDIEAAAARLVADLMPIAVTVAGPEAPVLAAALERAGAGADVFAAESPPDSGGFDLAVLLMPGGVGPAESTSLVTALAAVSDRLLFVPLPFGTAALPDLNAWFELFAEHGYQPVIEYDAAFLGQGALLVDRNATAAEAELASFAERVSLGGALAASTQRVATLEAELSDAGDRATLKAQLEASASALASCRAELAAAQARIAEAEAREAALTSRARDVEAEAGALRQQLQAWQRVGQWVAGWVAAPARTSLIALRTARGRAPRRGWLARWRRRSAGADAAERRLLEDAALLRASPVFDPVWYIASQSDMPPGEDPVLHYLIQGAAANADPGPYFSTADYRRSHPGLAGNPLAEAIRRGEAPNK